MFTNVGFTVHEADRLDCRRALDQGLPLAGLADGHAFVARGFGDCLPARRSRGLVDGAPQPAEHVRRGAVHPVDQLFCVESNGDAHFEISVCGGDDGRRSIRARSSSPRHQARKAARRSCAALRRDKGTAERQSERRPVRQLRSLKTVGGRTELRDARPPVAAAIEGRSGAFRLR